MPKVRGAGAQQPPVDLAALEIHRRGGWAGVEREREPLSSAFEPLGLLLSLPGQEPALYFKIKRVDERL